MDEVGNTLGSLGLPGLITAALTVFGILAMGFFNRRNNRDTAIASREPTMAQVWDRLDKVEKKSERLEGALDTERTARQKAEDMLRSLRDIFIDYVDRVQGGGTSELTPEEREALKEQP
jgi:hypothetical protein